MTLSKSLPVLFVAAVCMIGVDEAAAQARARGPVSRGPSVSGPAGRAVPRGGSVTGRPIYRPGFGGYYRPYYPYWWGYRPGFAFGFYGGFGDPWWGLGWGYPYYGYGPYGYGWGAPYYDNYGSYAANTNIVAYGGLRIKDAPKDAQVYADGYYAGIVNDFDGVTQHLNLQAGVHKIEVRMPGGPPLVFDVNIQPGQTITYHAGPQ